MDPLQTFEKLGIPLGLLAFLCLALWRAGVWFAPRVDKVVDATADNAATLKVMDAKVEAHQGEIRQHLVEIKGKLDSLIAQLAANEDAA